MTRLAVKMYILAQLTEDLMIARESREQRDIDGES
jgi:hypothetical protein